MVARKRRYNEVAASSDPPAEPEPPSMLQRIRNTWEFANIMQYIYIFGKALKIDEKIDIECLERECCLPGPSTVLLEIGLSLLKFVSSHRGLTPEIFDEYTRRQYVAKAPGRNPFGEDEAPKKFGDFDVFTKLDVLVQLSIWTLNNPDRIKEKMEDKSEADQASSWRVTEIGWDRDERTYFVLDDNRLYRRTDPPPPLVALKSKSKKTKPKSSGQRSSKRRKTDEPEDSANDADIDTPQNEEQSPLVNGAARADTFGGYKWECIAIYLNEYQDFLASIKGSRDPNEKELRQRILEDVMPIIESAEASQQRKRQREERELLHMQLLAGAKRSSRIEAKIEREKQEQEAQEAEQKRLEDLKEAKVAEKKQKQMDAERESRLMTRERRLQERETRRILHEQELARMSEEEKKLGGGEARLSERHLKAEMERKKQELAALQEEEEWTFDCSKCGKFGSNYDDGTHSVACEKCNVWQHSACLGISQEDAEREDFHFVCQDCKRREEDAKKPKIPTLKFRMGSSVSPPNSRTKVDSQSGKEVKQRKPKNSKVDSPSASAPESSPLPNGLHHIANSSMVPADRNPHAVQTSASSAGLSHATKSPQQPNQSFQPPPFLANGYSHSPSQPPTFNNFAYQTKFKTSPSIPVPRPAHTSPPGSTEAPQQQSQSNGLPPADHNPFANSLNEPLHHHHHHHHHPSPQTPISSFQANGYHPTAPTTDPVPVAASTSPIKLPSPSSSSLGPPPGHKTISPIAQPASLVERNAEPGRGISPVKAVSPAQSAGPEARWVEFSEGNWLAVGHASEDRPDRQAGQAG